MKREQSDWGTNRFTVRHYQCTTVYLHDLGGLDHLVGQDRILPSVPQSGLQCSGHHLRNLNEKT